LLCVPAVADNAAMQTEPPTADPPKRNRRWFQFRLRTLLIGVTLLCLTSGYVARQAQIVKDRETFRDAHVRFWQENDENSVPWLRRQFGDTTYNIITLRRESSKELRRHAAGLFPEATMMVLKADFDEATMTPNPPWELFPVEVKGQLPK
jgi:hypothetical protein